MRISMDGRGRWMDNVFIERVWRSLKYEDVYLKGYADGREAKAGISDWIIFYNEQRLHQALGYRAPMAVWRERRAAQGLWTCGQRKRVDHMPTGGSETAADTTLGGLIKDNPQTHFQLSRRQKRSRCAGPLQRPALDAIAFEGRALLRRRLAQGQELDQVLAKNEQRLLIGDRRQAALGPSPDGPFVTPRARATSSTE